MLPAQGEDHIAFGADHKQVIHVFSVREACQEGAILAFHDLVIGRIQATGRECPGKSHQRVPDRGHLGQGGGIAAPFPDQPFEPVGPLLGQGLQPFQDHVANGS